MATINVKRSKRTKLRKGVGSPMCAKFRISKDLPHTEPGTGEGALGWAEDLTNTKGPELTKLGAAGKSPKRAKDLTGREKPAVQLSITEGEEMEPVLLKPKAGAVKPGRAAERGGGKEPSRK